MPKAHALADSFGDNTIDPAKWTAYGGAQEVNQRVEIPLPSNTVNAYAGFTSVLSYDLTGSQVVVELVRTLRNDPSSETYLYLRTAAGDRLYYKVQDGRFYASKVPVGATSSTRLGEQPYDPARHRWMRIREQGNILSFDYSPNGQDWELLVSVPTPFSVSSVRIEIAAGTFQGVSAPGMAVWDNVNTPQTTPQRRVEERRLSARDVRARAAEVAAARRHDAHANNNDEVNYPGTPLVGNYSKSLRHDALGDPIPASYASLLRALESRDPGDFEEIILAAGTPVKLTNPQSGLTFDVEGPDPQEITMPPAPRFDSQVAANEEGELYWMAVLRDLPFVNYGTDAVAAAAMNSLNSEFPQFGGTTPVTARNLFRGIYPGEQVGPYVSQFLLKGNQDKRKPAGQGRDATDGFISYGARNIDQRLFPATAGVDYLADFPWWLDVQNGVDKRGQDTFDTTKRFIWNLRAGATFVHFDQVVDAFYNTAWILMSEPTGNQLSGSTARPQIDLEFPKDEGNPYDPPGTTMDSRTQGPFATFGPPHLLQALSEVMGRALRAVWWQKWGVHRRLRPEEYGGRVHNQVLFNTTGGAQGRSYPLHASITTSLQTGGLAPYFGQAGEKFPNAYLLPQAYPEGAPTHPAYGAGHATGAGACVTILKAFFDESAPIENPVQANATGTALVTYAPPVGEPPLTVGGELNKLAGNVALFRNAAGVHWRSDYTESLPLGEAIAIGLLQEMSLGFNEDDAFFELTRFDGQKIRILDGRVEPVVP
jgi:hypothetical protein